MSELDRIVTEAEAELGVRLSGVNRELPRVLGHSVAHNEPGRLERVVEMRKKGMGQRRVARALNVTNNGAWYWIKKADAVIREEEHASS